MKKILTLLFITGFMCLVNPVQAQNATSTGNQVNQVQQLQEQIKALQAQIDKLTSELAATKSEVALIKEELRITKTLKLGMAGDEVKKLQGYLSAMPDIYPEGLITGYFGPLTEKAVKKWQAMNNIESVGVVGPITRSKISEVTSAGIPGRTPSTKSDSPKVNESKDITPPGTEKHEENNATTTSVVTTPTATTSIATTTPVVDTSVVTGNNNGGQSSPTQTPILFSCPTPNQMVTICHNGQTMMVSCNATGPEGHSNHISDTLGACSVTPVDTIAPIISNIQSTATQTTATITWTTNESADSKIIIATSTLIVVESSTIATSHSLNINNLNSGSTYNYVVVSKDLSGNITTSSGQSFTTLATPSTPPNTAPITVTYPRSGDILGNLNVSFYYKSNGINKFGFRIYKGVQVVYEYPGYFSLAVPLSYPTGYTANLTVDNGSYRIQFPCANLCFFPVSGNDYRVRVFDWDNPGTFGDSNYFSYDTTPPIITVSSVSASSVTANSAIITWTTDTPTTGFVNYGSTPTNWMVTPNNTSYSTSHSLTLSNLASNTIYRYRVYSTDALGNSPQGVLPEYTFTTLSGPISCSDIDLTLNDGKTTYTKGVDNFVSYTWTCIPGGSANINIIVQKPGSLGQSSLSTSNSSSQTFSVDISGTDYPSGTYDLIGCFGVCGSTIAEKRFIIQ